jgi:hypothetical protein
LSFEEKDSIIDEKMEIILCNDLHDDFVQLDYHTDDQEQEQQQQIKDFYRLSVSIFKIFICFF